MNEQDDQAAFEVIRKALDNEYKERLNLWSEAEQRAMQGDPHYPECAVADFFSDFQDACRAKALLNEMVRNLTSPRINGPCVSCH